MLHAADFNPRIDAAAAEWARTRIARTLVRAAMHSADVVYRRTWPSKEALERLAALEVDSRLARNGWLGSTLDLRDGLSVVEVFAADDEESAATAREEFADARR